MGLEDLLDLAGDLDPRKAIDLADDLWDDRDKITEVVALVWENKDRLTEALDWIADHGDDLLELAGRLPDVLSSAGDALDAAGEGAVRAAHFLTGDADDEGAVNALTDVAAAALERCREELRGVEEMITGLGKQFDEVRIPTLETKTTEIAGFSVISGIDIGSVGLVDKAADQLESGARKISSVADDLATVADKLRRLGESVTDAGGDLAVAGDQLATSGSTLKELTGASSGAKAGGAPRKPTSRRRPSTSTRKPSGRRSPTKKSTAKKKPAAKKAKKKSTAKRSTTKKAVKATRRS